MRMSPLVLALVLSAGLLPACHGDSPRSVASAPRVQKAQPAPAPAPARSLPTQWVPNEPGPEPEPEEPLDPAGVLDEEERRLLEADDATLTREERVARAHAQRKLVMADPEHPLRPLLAKIEQDVASGAATKRAQDMWSGRVAFPDRDEADAGPEN